MSLCGPKKEAPQENLEAPQENAEAPERNLEALFLAGGFVVLPA